MAQGGDWGNAVTEQMALQKPPGLSAFTPTCRPPFPTTSPRRSGRRPGAAGLSADEKGTRATSSTSSTSTAWATPRRWRTARRRCTRWRIRRSGSPPGCSTTTRAVYALIARVFDGQTEGLTRDDILDNVTLYWLTNTAVSSARLYWEKQARLSSPEGRRHAGRSERLSGRDLSAPRSWAEKAYPKLIHYNRLPKGGHFAAWEQPQLFSEELSGVPEPAQIAEQRMF